MQDQSNSYLLHALSFALILLTWLRLGQVRRQAERMGERLEKLEERNRE